MDSPLGEKVPSFLPKPDLLLGLSEKLPDSPAQLDSDFSVLFPLKPPPLELEFIPRPADSPLGEKLPSFLPKPDLLLGLSEKLPDSPVQLDSDFSVLLPLKPVLLELEFIPRPADSPLGEKLPSFLPKPDLPLGLSEKLPDSPAQLDSDFSVLFPLKPVLLELEFTPLPADSPLGEKLPSFLPKPDLLLGLSEKLPDSPAQLDSDFSVLFPLKPVLLELEFTPLPADSPLGEKLPSFLPKLGLSLAKGLDPISVLSSGFEKLPAFLEKLDFPLDPFFDLVANFLGLRVNSGRASSSFFFPL